MIATTDIIEIFRYIGVYCLDTYFQSLKTEKSSVNYFELNLFTFTVP